MSLLCLSLKLNHLKHLDLSKLKITWSSWQSSISEQSDFTGDGDCWPLPSYGCSPLASAVTALQQFPADPNSVFHGNPELTDGEHANHILCKDGGGLSLQLEGDAAWMSKPLYWHGKQQTKSSLPTKRSWQKIYSNNLPLIFAKVWGTKTFILCGCVCVFLLSHALCLSRQPSLSSCTHQSGTVTQTYLTVHSKEQTWTSIITILSGSIRNIKIYS